MSYDIDEEVEGLYWKFDALKKGVTPFSDRDAFKRIVRPLLCAATYQNNKALRAERDALRALLVAVPAYLASLEARITHACPLKDGATTLRNAINAALREGK